MHAQNGIRIVLFLFLFGLISCHNRTDRLKKSIGDEEYHRLMQLSPDAFDQSSDGFRQYSNDYEVIQLLIPEYIEQNALSNIESRNMHWHLGQIHAFNGQYEKAILEMKQAYAGGSKTWEYYVSGSIAFLEKDEEALKEAFEMLVKQENQMNIEVLEKFIRYFDLTYAEAMNAE